MLSYHVINRDEDQWMKETNCIKGIEQRENEALDHTTSCTTRTSCTDIRPYHGISEYLLLYVCWLVFINKACV